MRLAKVAVLFTLASAAALGPGQCGRTEARSHPALHDDHGGHLWTALADGLPAGWPHAGHRKDRARLAGLRSRERRSAPLGNTPAVYWQGQNGMLGVFVSPHYATDQSIYLTYVEPGDYGGGLALARAKLNVTATHGETGKFRGAVAPDAQRARAARKARQVAFSPDGQYLFLTVGDRQRMTPAQDPDQPVGKILRLTLDGKPAPGNPNFGKTGAATIPLIDPPRDTEAAKTAKPVSTYTFPGPNLTPAETWASGFRTPYGLAFSPTGELWEVEHGPRGGDELNLIEKGKNYGWPLVSYGMNYNERADSQSRHAARPREAGALLGAGDRAGQSDVLPRHQDLPAMERQRLHQRHGDACRSTASSSTARAEPRPPSAGMSANASAMWNKAPMVRCGCWKTPIPAP